MSNPRENKKTKLSNSAEYSVRASSSSSASQAQLQINDHITSTSHSSQRTSPPPHLFRPQNDPMSFFSEEISLHIFETLTPADLGNCACVSRLWYRLVNDQMLWRRLFLGYRFVFPRGLRILGAIMEPESFNKGSNRNKRRHSSSRPIQTQPCWKALYKLNYNWVMGQARVTTVSAQELSRRDRNILDIQDSIENGTAGSSRIQEGTRSPIVQFKASTILISGPRGIVHLWRIKDVGLPSLPSSGSQQQLEYWQTFRSSWLDSNISHDKGIHTTPQKVVYLSLDTQTERDSVGWQKVMVGYSSGHFSVFEYLQRTDPMDKSGAISTFKEIGNTASLSSWVTVGRIVAAAFCYPIITTCSDNGSISIYMIQENPSATSPQNWCRLLHKLYGTPSGSPIGISLEKITSSKSTGLKGIRWRVLVSFGLELYDGSWTVRLQETEFNEQQILSSIEIGAEGNDISENGDEGYSSSASVYSKLGSLGDCIPSTSHGRVRPISGISISWPFVVTTHKENTLNVFQVDRTLNRINTQDSTDENQQQSRFKRGLRFQHLSTLYGHCGAVSSVSIESRSGRLVSASMDRSIKIWTTALMNHEDLLVQRRVHQCVVSISDIDKSWTENGQVTKEEGSGLIWVGSDEEKIVSMSVDGVVKVWQFS